MPIELDSSHSFDQHLELLLARVDDPALKAFVEANLVDISAIGASGDTEARRRLADALEDLATTQAEPEQAEEVG